MSPPPAEHLPGPLAGPYTAESAFEVDCSCRERLAHCLAKFYTSLPQSDLQVAGSLNLVFRGGPISGAARVTIDEAVVSLTPSESLVQISANVAGGTKVQHALIGYLDNPPRYGRSHDGNDATRFNAIVMILHAGVCTR